MGRHGTGVADLGGDRGTLGMHGVGEGPQAGHRLVGPQDLVGRGSSFRRDRAVGDRGHPDPTGGVRPVEVDEVGGDPRAMAQTLVRRCLQ
ncbi:MAG: hypothetical protein ABIW17_00570, partial [Marmoricola sp.]